ncbi:MAG: choice-of-anchor P family protein [Nocardioides sp.]
MPAPTRHRPRRWAAGVASGALAAGLVLASPAALAAPSGTAVVSAVPSTAASAASAPERSTTLRSTRFAFRANGYGTSVVGGAVPAESSRTAVSSIGCTNLLGKDNSNTVVDAELPGLLQVGTVDSTTQTKRVKGRSTSIGKHKVADVSIGVPGVLTLGVSAVNTVAKAWFGPDGYGSRATTSLGRLTLRLPGGLEQTLPLPTPERPVTVPGLLRIQLGRTIERANATEARSYATGLEIKIIPTDTVVKISRSAAKIEEGERGGIFNGAGAPVQVSLLGDLVKVGQAVVQRMPCLGTGGERLEEAAASVDLAGALRIEGAQGTTRTTQNRGKDKAKAVATATVGRVDLGEGTLVIDAIRSKATAVRTGRKVNRSSDGTTVGSISFNGQAFSLPDLDGIEIPGLAKIETDVRKRTPFGIQVVALRITLLEGTEVDSVVDIGSAKVKIRPF